MRTAQTMRLDRTGIFASLIVAALALSLASCGSGASTAPSTTGTAMIRFINGSPDAGAFDVLVNGKVIASDIVYGQISTYTTQTVGTNPLPQVAFVQTGTQTNIFSPASGTQGQTFQLGAAPGTKVTVVVEGRKAFIGSLGLNIGAFVEPTITTPTGQYAVVFHHASPAASVAAPNGIVVGQVELGPVPIYLGQGTMLFGNVSGTIQSIFGLQAQPAYIGPPGVGFFAAPVVIPTATPVPLSSTTATPTPVPSPTATPLSSPTIYAVVLPGPPAVLPSPANDNFPVTGVDSSNINQSMPFGTSDVNLFVYLIDSTATPGTGSELIGTFNN